MRSIISPAHASGFVMMSVFPVAAGVMPEHRLSCADERSAARAQYGAASLGCGCAGPDQACCGSLGAGQGRVQSAGARRAAGQAG